jgi:hypothetical protein
MKKLLFILPFLPACLDVYLNPIEKDDTGGDTVSDTGIGPESDPTLSELTLSPNPAFTNDVLTATATTNDGQGGTPEITWAWFVNGTDLELDTATLNGVDAFDKGDSVEVQATPYNEEGAGETTSVTLVISNTAPTAATIDLTPNPVYENGDDLHCALTQPATDDDGDTLSYTIAWDVDGTAYNAGFKTALDNDTVSGGDLLEGQTWICTLYAEDDEEAGPSVSASTTILAAEVTLAECTTNLTSVSSPTTHATASGGGTYGIGNWFAESDPSASSGFWIMMGYKGDEATEYPSLADVQSGSNMKNLEFEEDWMGMGQVALNGVIYVAEKDTNTLMAFDTQTETILSSATLPGALLDGNGTYSYGAKSSIDLSTDDGKLYAIYTTTQANGTFVVSEIDPSSLAVLNTWTHASAEKQDYASAFIACGVLYAIDDVNDGMCFWCDEQSIDLAWNWATGASSNPAIPWTNPGTSGYIGGVNYNPADGQLYVVRGGNLATLTPSFQ